MQKPKVQPTFDAMQAIAHPKRQQILQLILKNSLTINAIVENFDISRPAVSKHIKILETANFVSIENIGRERHCLLKQDGFNKLQEFINYFNKFWKESLKN